MADRVGVDVEKSTRAYNTHGRSRDPNYVRHQQMMRRCYNPQHPAYKWYGARGIRVHESWHDVSAFCDWMAVNLGPCPPGYSFDRIDNDRGYEPGNVRWATWPEQRTNQRSITKSGLTCVVCGASFSATRSHAQYCSSRCREWAKYRRKCASGKK